MKEEIKKIKRHVYKHLPTYGFIGAVCLIGGAISYFNHLWTALGENPKTDLLPQITKDYEEFKDHATLLIALIAAMGSILSSLIIVLFYDAWKEQHNRTVLAEEAKPILVKFINELYAIQEIKSAFNEQTENDVSRFSVTDEKVHKALDKLSKLNRENKESYTLFSTLVDKENTATNLLDYLASGGNLIKFHNKCHNEVLSYKAVKEEYSEKLTEVEKLCIDIINDLKTYIFIQ